MHLCHQADLLDTAVYPDIQAMSMGQWDSTNCVEPWVAKRDKIAIQLSIQSVAQNLMWLRQWVYSFFDFGPYVQT